MNRDQRALLAKQTLEILASGTYRAPSGRDVNIAAEQERSVRNTVLYRPTDFPSNLLLPSAGRVASIEVTGETSLDAARRLSAEVAPPDPLCLNFASAKNPGGGFLGGSQAQEESLSRSSGLYACLEPMREMYEHNRRLDTCLYSDHMIYSPSVPVFRDDGGRLLDEPYLVSFLSVPAVNAGAVRRNEPVNVDRIEAVMRSRTEKMLWVAASRGHRALVLGAWGCGVFANDPVMIARLFAEHLTGEGRFATQFDRVVLAVFDRTPDQSVLNAFRQELITDH